MRKAQEAYCENWRLEASKFNLTLPPSTKLEFLFLPEEFCPPDWARPPRPPEVGLEPPGDMRSIPWYIMVYQNILRYTMVNYDKLCYTVVYHGILSYTMVYHRIPWYTMVYHVRRGIQWRTLAYHAAPLYTMVYNAMAYHVILRMSSRGQRPTLEALGGGAPGIRRLWGGGQSLQVKSRSSFAPGCSTCLLSGAMVSRGGQQSLFVYESDKY